MVMYHGNVFQGPATKHQGGERDAQFSGGIQVPSVAVGCHWCWTAFVGVGAIIGVD